MSIGGTLTALITPFTETDEVDWDSLEGILEAQVRAEVDALVLLGTTGEALSLNVAEQMQIARFALERVGKKLPIWLGCGTSSTKSTLENCQRAEQLGAKGAMIVTPPYVKPNHRGICDHFAAICAHVDLPIMIYNNPGRCGCALGLKTLLELCRLPKVAAIKESAGDISQWVDLIHRRPERVSILAGDDGSLFAMLALGACGAVSVLANSQPRRVRRLVDDLLAGRLKIARARFARLWPYLRALELETNPLIVKALLQAQGLCGARARAPLGEIEETSRLQLAELIRDLPPDDEDVEGVVMS